jgi:hypothetical protein
VDIAVRHAPCKHAGVDQRTRYSHTLWQAVATLGGQSRLALFLGVPEDKLTRWLSGEELAPLDVFLNSLDLIAEGPYAPAEHPIRVAVIRERT